MLLSGVAACIMSFCPPDRKGPAGILASNDLVVDTANTNVCLRVGDGGITLSESMPTWHQQFTPGRYSISLPQVEVIEQIGADIVRREHDRATSPKNYNYGKAVVIYPTKAIDDRSQAIDDDYRRLLDLRMGHSHAINDGHPHLNSISNIDGCLVLHGNNISDAKQKAKTYLGKSVEIYEALNSAPNFYTYGNDCGYFYATDVCNACETKPICGSNTDSSSSFNNLAALKSSLTCKCKEGWTGCGNDGGASNEKSTALEKKATKHCKGGDVWIDSSSFTKGNGWVEGGSQASCHCRCSANKQNEQAGAGGIVVEKASINGTSKTEPKIDGLREGSITDIEYSFNGASKRGPEKDVVSSIVSAYLLWKSRSI